MKSFKIWIFFSVVLFVYLLVSWYVYSRGVLALNGSIGIIIFEWAYWILVFSFVAGQILERGKPTIVARVITHIGSIWLSVFLYLLLFVLSVDLIRLLNLWLNFIPDPIFSFISNSKLLFVSAWVFSFAITALGWLNARYPIIHNVEIQIDKKIKTFNELVIVLVSDIHMGAMIGKKRISEMVEKINAQNPDLVLLAGDLVDHNPLFMKYENIGPEFLKLKASLGMYAIAGNHEFIGHADISIDYLQSYGIEYIRDSVINIDGILQIAGRDDRERKHHEGTARKPLEQVLENVNNELLLILMDHQPVEYDLVEQFGVDIMVSGHTHKGQLWPFGYITKAVFENDYGLIKKGKTYFYTSSGYGTWGPPIRTGNRPEMLVITVKGNVN